VHDSPCENTAADVYSGNKTSKQALFRAPVLLPAVLDDLGVQYWADFGTLLGMYREVSWQLAYGDHSCDSPYLGSQLLKTH
jgi:hypothetical protein